MSLHFTLKKKHRLMFHYLINLRTFTLFALINASTGPLNKAPATKNISN